MQAIQIKILNKEKLFIKWDDGSESAISLKYLRDECPCANCKGETVLLKTYRPPKPPTTNPDMYKIKSIDVVGGYAIQIVWKDNHNTGIAYPPTTSILLILYISGLVVGGLGGL